MLLILISTKLVLFSSVEITADGAAYTQDSVVEIRGTKNKTAWYYSANMGRILQEGNGGKVD